MDCYCDGGPTFHEARVLEELRECTHELPGLWFGGARLYVKAHQRRKHERV